MTEMPPKLQETEVFTKEVVITLSTPPSKIKALLPALYRIFGTIPISNSEDTKITYYLTGNAVKIDDDLIRQYITATIGAHVIDVKIGEKKAEPRPNLFSVYK